MENLYFVSDPDLISIELLGSSVLALDGGALPEEGGVLCPGRSDDFLLIST